MTEIEEKSTPVPYDDGEYVCFNSALAKKVGISVAIILHKIYLMMPSGNESDARIMISHEDLVSIVDIYSLSTVSQATKELERRGILKVLGGPNAAKAYSIDKKKLNEMI